jgi:hypothetical protein
MHSRATNKATTRGNDTGSGGTLSPRALNRATLARQLLLRRDERSALDAIEHLVGMQAQAPLAPYIGLWTRLDGFQPGDLAQLLLKRRVVRTTLMRGTVHLVSDRDCLALRPLLQPMLSRALYTGAYRAGLVGIDVAEVVAFGRALLDEQPRSAAALGKLLVERWPDRDGASLAQAVQLLATLIQIPPRGIWGQGGAVSYATAESWLGRPLAADPSLGTMVLRYLAAFGPASVRDVQAWSRLTRLGEVVDRLRPRLLTFRDERGVELFDLPDAPRPDADTPAPPRFLPEYDNLLLSHADRTRVISDGRTVPLLPGNGGVAGTVLLDGCYRATWKIARDRDSATLLITPFAPLGSADRAALEDEGAQLLAFAAAETSGREIRFVAE